MTKIQPIAYGAILMLMTGWLLYIGKDVFVPVFFGAVAVYIIVGLTQALVKIPLLGRILPVQVRYTLSLLVIALGLIAMSYLVLINKNQVLALAPQYQQSLLSAIQKIAVLLQVENEPTWATLRQDVLAQVNIQRVVGSMLTSVSSIAAGVIVVLLYATFLSIERRAFDKKMANISSDSNNVARVRAVISDINRRVGSYLALKTFLSVLLGAISWLIMLYTGLEFAAFLAVLITFLNFIPYIGSFLSVVFPLLMAIIQFQDMNAVFTLFMLLVFVQFAIGNFLDPFVMGKSLNLSPFAILVNLAIWTELWGIPGAFLAVPITAILTIIFSEFPGTRPIAVLLSKDGTL